MAENSNIYPGVLSLKCVPLSRRETKTKKKKEEEEHRLIHPCDQDFTFKQRRSFTTQQDTDQI